VNWAHLSGSASSRHRPLSTMQPPMLVPCPPMNLVGAVDADVDPVVDTAETGSASGPCCRRPGARPWRWPRRQSFVVQHVVLGVSQGLDYTARVLGRIALGDRLRTRGVDKGHVDAQPLEGLSQQGGSCRRRRASADTMCWPACVRFSSDTVIACCPLDNGQSGDPASKAAGVVRARPSSGSSAACRSSPSPATRINRPACWVSRKQ